MIRIQVARTSEQIGLHSIDICKVYLPCLKTGEIRSGGAETRTHGIACVGLHVEDG